MNENLKRGFALLEARDRRDAQCHVRNSIMVTRCGCRCQCRSRGA
jgi:hypothetical protein